MRGKKKYNPPIKDWPESDRPREKLISQGADALSDAELLAIMLRTGEGKTGSSALDHARALINKFGALEELEKAGINEICGMQGIGPAKAATIKAALALGRRLGTRKVSNTECIQSPEDVFNRFRPKLGNLKKETFWAILLDVRGKVIREVKISEGTLTEALVHPREAFQLAVRESAARIIFVHNHPSGDPTPSPADLELTERLVEAGKLLGIPVLDHVVVCADSFRSADLGENAKPMERMANDSEEE